MVTCLKPVSEWLLPVGSIQTRNGHFRVGIVQGTGLEDLLCTVQTRLMLTVYIEQWKDGISLSCKPVWPSGKALGW